MLFFFSSCDAFQRADVATELSLPPISNFKLKIQLTFFYFDYTSVVRTDMDKKPTDVAKFQKIGLNIFLFTGPHLCACDVSSRSNQGI